jgi:hypothetical protein
MGTGGTADDGLRCPICGVGRLQDLAYDEGSVARPLEQQADSHEIQTFTCGHTVDGPSLSTADAEGLDAERRDSAETVDPPQS